jgi:cell division inhibitor SulA/protein ImuA
MRAATELLSLLHTAGGAPLWRADELPAEDAGGPTLASGFAELDRELAGGGWPQGQLIELLTDDAGIGELSLLAPALAQLAQSRRSAVWVLPVDAARATPRSLEAQAVPYAPALATAGLDLARTIFVKPATPRESLWAVEQSLRARHLGAVVGWLPHAGGEGDFRALRRLHLLAQSHQALAFVLRSTRQAQAPSPATLRLQLASAGAQLQVTLLKRRGRPLLDPITLQLRPAHWEQARVEADTAPPRAVPAATALLDVQRPLDELLA